MNKKIKKTEEKPTCGTCRYYLQVQRNVFGLCRRFPPDRIHNGVSGLFPEVADGCWCGEHGPKLP